MNPTPTRCGLRLFDRAFAVHDLDAARRFHAGLRGCPEGRGSPECIDSDLHARRIVANPAPEECRPVGTSAVDAVPPKHFGVVLRMAEWQVLADKRRAGGTPFFVEPHGRFKRLDAEQATRFFPDPLGNALELHAFADLGQHFATQ